MSVDSADTAEATDLLAALREVERSRAELLSQFQATRDAADAERDQIGLDARLMVAGDLLDFIEELEQVRREGALTPDLAVVVAQLIGGVAAMGLSRFGGQGDPYDERLHEAKSRTLADPSVAVPTCMAVTRPGYRLGGVVLRRAVAIVADPADDPLVRPWVGIASDEPTPLAQDIPR